MARRVILVAGGLVATLVLLLVLAAAAILASAPGHAVARKLAVEALTRAVDGRVTIGALGGSLWRAAVLENVELATNDGRPVIRVGRVTVRYALADVVRGRFVLSRVVLDHPTVMLERLPDGHLTLEHLFRLVRPPSAPHGGTPPLVELDAVTVTGGTVVIRDLPAGAGPAADPTRERRFTGLDLTATRVVVSSPDSAGVRADLRHLAVTVSDPATRVVDAAGRVVIRGDSASFDLPHLALPGTTGRAEGVVRWGKLGRDRASVDVAAALRRASTADFRWAVPGLPASGEGSVAVRARLFPGGGGAFTLTDADFRTGGSHVTGTADFELRKPGGTIIHRLDADAEPMDLALLEPFLGRMPVTGLVRGHLTASGTPQQLDVGADLVFADGRVAGQPENRVSGSGLVSLGGRDAVVFHRFAVTDGDLAMASVAAFAPSITLGGRLAVTGTLDGPWHDATLDGAVAHRGGDGPTSHVRGTVRLTLADTVRIDADVLADSLSLDDLARSYPSIPLTGALGGRVTVRGPVTALAITADLAGPRAGGGGSALSARGTISSQADDVALDFGGALKNLDLAPLLPGAPTTRLTGSWRARLAVPGRGAADAVRDSAAALTGALRFELSQSRVAGMEVSAAGAAVSVTPERLEVDTAYVEQRGVKLVARGALGRGGRGEGSAGRLVFDLEADTLAELEPFAAWLGGRGGGGGLTGDSTRLGLGGSGHAKVEIVGTTAAWRAQGDVSADSVSYGALVAQGARVGGAVSRSADGLAFDLRAGADSLGVGAMRYDRVQLLAAGPREAVRVHVGAAFALGSSAEADLVVGVDSTRWDARLEAMTLALPRRRWTLARPAHLAGAAGGRGTGAGAGAGIAVDSLVLVGSGGALVRVAGVIPGDSAGDVTIEADSVPLADAYALAQADTAGNEGDVSGSLRVQGTAASPRIAARATLVDGRFGDFRAPRVDASAEYAARRLDFQGSLSRGDATVVTASGSLPLDLALTSASVAERRVAGPLELKVRADSVDLSVLDALTSLVRSTSGRLAADFTVRGTWDQPQFEGGARIRDGAASVPALGARYTGIEARLVLSGDRLTVEQARVGGGLGSLDVSGDVRFESLTRPVLNLTLTARNFAAFTERNFAGLTASGTMDLTGPLLGATLRGRVTVDAGFLAFADLVEKRIINLDDPEFRAVVDSNLAGAEQLQPTPESVFLDSLRIERLTVSLGPDVWLRSHEANIQLAGDFTVVRGVEQGIVRYRLDGTLRAVRGTYRLVVGPTAKEFRVTRGTVRFFGTPDFNPELDIVAEHSVRAVHGNDLVVRVVIGGTLLVPRLSLESDQRPPLSESEIVSYLLFGRPSADLTSGGGGGGGGGAASSEQAIFQGALAGLAGAVSGELAQTLVSDLGIPVDYLAIRPGGGTVGDIFGSTRVEAGTQIGERTFLTVNAGLCQVARGLASQTLGASVEYRLSHRWSLEASIEPTVQECRPGGFQIRPPVPYQVGMDLFWQLGGP